MKHLYDVFICHASEDKESLVRPLANLLREEHLAVWYDEFELRIGDSLRESIDRGLASSRFGIVVLSKSFFGKNWPKRELDGLVAREMIGGHKVILPIWHEMGAEEVCSYSPPLADLFSVASSIGLQQIVKKIVDVVHPQGSPLIIARDRLIQLGHTPPVVTDEWWLDVVEASNRQTGWGFMPEGPAWDRWTFPLPPRGEPRDRGERLAWTALQLQWEENAANKPITQITEPEIVLEFIDSEIGLREACCGFPEFLANYAPQLTIPGFGGDFESAFDVLLKKSEAEQTRLSEQCGTALTVTKKKPLCDEYIALRHPNFGDYAAVFIAGQYVQGEISGPPVRYYLHFEYLAWLLSKKSSWLPQPVREYLLAGMKEWKAWLWAPYLSIEDSKFGLERYPDLGALHESLDSTRRTKFEWNKKSLADLLRRLELSCSILSLPEKPTSLSERFVEGGFAESYFERDLMRTHAQVLEE